MRTLILSLVLMALLGTLACTAAAPMHRAVAPPPRGPPPAAPEVASPPQAGAVAAPPRSFKPETVYDFVEENDTKAVPTEPGLDVIEANRPPAKFQPMVDKKYQRRGKPDAEWQE